MKRILILLALACAFAASGKEGNWRTMIGKTGDLAGETGIAAFASKEAPAYITGNTAAADRAAKPDLSKPRTGSNIGANRNGYWTTTENGSEDTSMTRERSSKATR